jgi:two-component system, chemotaxis family, CheB/CheR fusion protein
MGEEKPQSDSVGGSDIESAVPSEVPVGGDEKSAQAYLVVFEPPRTGLKTQQAREEPGPAVERDEHQVVARVTQELIATRGYMQSLIEQREAANEELQSANEEIRAANEALQTSKEEIQSNNEELTTVNDELRNRNEQLDRAHNDLVNVLASSSLPMVMVGPDLRIRWFSPAAEKSLNLAGRDHGRPIAHLRLPLSSPDLEEGLSDVIASGRSREYELQDEGGRWHSLQLRPYRTERNRIDGAVFVLVDIDAQKRVVEGVRQSRVQLAAELAAMSRLYEVSTKLVSCTDIRSALEHILDAAIVLTGADMGNVQLLDADGKRLSIVAHRGFRQEFIDFFREVTADDDSACGRALRTGARVVIEDVEIDPGFEPYRQAASAAGYRAVQSTLLRSRGGQALGVLSTHFRVPHRPAEEALKVLTLYARMAADIIDLLRADERLRLADRRKDEFLAVLAHELRGPLAPLRNHLELLARTQGLSDVTREARDIMERQVSHLTRLIDDLLDVSRISRGKLEMRAEPVDLVPVVREAVESCRPLADHHRLRMNITLPSRPLFVHGDPVRLVQTFSNLLQNACKFSEPEGTIGVTAEQVDSEVVVRVQDSGIGIPPEKLCDIFEMFVQVDQSLERAHGGLGLGLALVKKLIDLHGGKVTAQSDGLGSGSEFVVRLPILHAQTKADIAPELPVPASGSVRRILVADDNLDSATSLALLLQLSGHETELAHDGVEAVEKAAAFRPDMIVLDIGMPRRNGYDACRAIREQPWGKSVLIVALTGLGQAEDRRKSIDAGFNFHLVKPVEYATLMKLLPPGSL